jgi:3-hydroxyisobutyrate dehydrogenase-like beta-hydroxyacid dehydrogenase
MNTDVKGTVGVIGLGIMGNPIARNLATAGWRVVGYDLDAARCREAAAHGVEIAADAGAVARAAPVILTSLPKPAALIETAEAIVAAGAGRRTVAELSTFAIPDKERAEAVLRAGGHVLLDCPLSGTGAQARVKDLVIYASGDSQAIKTLEPVFRDFGRATHDLGAFGNGMKMKYVANLLVAIHNVASAEAMVLGIKAGLDPHQVYDLVKSGAGTSRVFELRAGMMADNRYDGDNVTMKVSIWQKDMTVIGDFARETGVPTPTFSACAPIYNAAMSMGHAGDDTAAVCAVLEAMAGVKRD